MRLVYLLMLILLGFALAGFLVTNPGEQVDVTLGSRVHENVPLSVVALAALTVGVAFTAVVGLIEGATTRLANRRLRREIQRLETENSYLRSQSRQVSALTAEPAPRPLAAEPEFDEQALADAEDGRASAPVYDPDGDDAATRFD